MYAWGRGEHGRLGFGDDKSSHMVPLKVELLAGEDIVQVIHLNYSSIPGMLTSVSSFLVALKWLNNFLLQLEKQSSFSMFAGIMRRNSFSGANSRWPDVFCK